MSTAAPYRSRCRALFLCGALIVLGVGHAHVRGRIPPAGLIRGDLEVGALIILSALLYLAGLLRLKRRSGRPRGVGSGQIAAFTLGCVALAGALLGPIDELSGDLFALHMVQHEVLMLVAAPLLVLGHPLPMFLWAFPQRIRASLGRAARRRWLVRSWDVLTQPLSGWSLHAAALWGWHAPALFEAALEHPRIHDLQHFTFLATALIFWTGLLRSRRGTNEGLSVLYLFTTTVHSGVLGALITCASHPWFPHYRETAPAWGLSALQDQQLGGLIMWIPASLVYVAVALVLLARWIRTSALASARTAQ